MGVLPACSKDRMYTLVFLTVEADPSLTKEEVKSKLVRLIRAEKPKEYAVAYEISAGGYRHAHVVMRFPSPRRVIALCKHLSHEMRFTKPNGTATSVRAFAPRRGGESWPDMLSYVTDKKHKVQEVCDDAVTIGEVKTWTRSQLARGYMKWFAGGYQCERCKNWNTWCCDECEHRWLG